ncbi:hypothetical protein H257_09765 [Aphanomyces astaci]|uniref:Uncharacterized protein n=1 Tax=Aphanomyces astaci TaxID=112090 RepID=W4GB54_APHAT|nr:hypothetical protein H257_09765 [Aphanomyces astaci]ETV76294.1 hypothetical protein H257_09765 [Aphanomyces astaci]|eukprot:XP_009834419.1 hypothetical protein H257_09765 [Aphanomyces astaci]
MDFEVPDGVAITFDTFSPQHSSSCSYEDGDDSDKVDVAADTSDHPQPSSSPFSNVIDTWYLGDIMDKINALDAVTGGRVRDVLTKLRSRAYAPVPLDNASWTVVFCSLCQRYATHDAAHHLCRICHRMGDHTTATCTLVPPLNRKCTFCGSQPTGHDSNDHCCVHCYTRGQHNSCGRSSLSSVALSWSSHVASSSIRSLEPPPLPVAAPGSSTTTNSPATTPATTPATSSATATSPPGCAFCGGTDHDTVHHRCRRCHIQGHHRSRQCTSKSSLGSSVVSTLLALPAQAIVHQYRSTLSNLSPWTSRSDTTAVFLLSDMELRLRHTLQRLGLWGAGSQTPIGTPNSDQYHAPAATSLATSLPPTPPPLPPHYSVVVAYREGSSVVPDRILKFMRLLMHTNVSTNAFHVEVHANASDDKRPGMVSPKSLPPSPQTRAAYQTHMDGYTESVLVGAKLKLVAYVQTAATPQV